MADDPLRELLSSPLERPARRERPPSEVPAPRSGAGGWWMAAAVLAGGIVMLGGYLIAADETAPPTTTAVPTTTTTTAATAGPVLPAGFTLVDGRLGMRVERVLIRPAEVLVTLSSVVPAGLQPTDTAGFPGGRWDLVLADGRRITSTEEGADALAQGFVSVRFPVTDVDAGSITGIELTGIGNRLSQVVSASAADVVVPADGGEVEAVLDAVEFPLDDGVVLRFDRLAIATQGAVLDWSLAGDDPDAVGSIAPFMTLVGDGEPQASNPRVDTGQFRFFLSFLGLNPLAREGRAYFDPQTPAGFTAPETGITVNLDVEVTWTVFSPTRASLPIGDAPVATMEE